MENKPWIRAFGLNVTSIEYIFCHIMYPTEDFWIGDHNFGRSMGAWALVIHLNEKLERNDMGQIIRHQRAIVENARRMPPAQTEEVPIDQLANEIMSMMHI